MKRLLWLLLLPLNALAASVPLSWTAPTQNVDGSAITGSVTYNIYGALQGQPKVKLVGPTSGLAYTDVTSVVGTWCYEAASH